MLTGRKRIYLAEDNINSDNIADCIKASLPLHLENCSDEDYLYNYRKGIQPILNRTKRVRPEICNRVVVNNAQQIVTFKSGYFMTKPAYNTSLTDDKDVVERVASYNQFLRACGKSIADKEVIDDFLTCGLGVLFVEPNKLGDKRKPVDIYSLRPQQAYVAYSMRPGNKPLLGVNVVQAINKLYVDAYTEHEYFKFEISLPEGYKALDSATTFVDWNIANISLVSVGTNVIGQIPIIEYQYNSLRQSCFENAIPIMDLINKIESDVADGIEQQIQQIWVAFNVDGFKDENGNDVSVSDVAKSGLLCLHSNGDVKQDIKAISATLDQIQTQTTLDNLYEQLLIKCSMPSTTKGGTSTSDTGTAVYLRDGFYSADIDSQNQAELFKKSNAYFDLCMLSILRMKGFELNPYDFELNIEHNSASNLLTKTQVAMNLKSLGLSPEICFERSGISTDPLMDIEKSAEYIKLAWNGEEANEENSPMDGENE